MSDDDAQEEVMFDYAGRESSVPSDVTYVRFHPSVVEADKNAFKDCIKLQEVVFNKGLQKIGENAFEGCKSLQSITLPSTVNGIDDGAFYKCTHLRTVVLNKGLKRIGQDAFGFTVRLESITLPSTVNEIGYKAFHGCRSLQEVVINNEEIQIQDGYEAFLRRGREVEMNSEEIHFEETAFVGCRLLRRFSFPGLSTRLNHFIQAGQRGIEAKMNDISAVEWRGGELTIPVTYRDREFRMGTLTLVEVDKEKLDKIVRLIRYYEIKEVTTTLELAFWKAKIDQVDDNDDVEPADRDARRIEVPGPVKDAIMQYL